MLSYTKGVGEYKNWILAEEDFNPECQGKCESIMALGNGYLGLRSAFEEPYVGQTRNLFVAGTYNKSDINEVTELPNAADVVETQIYLNSELFSLTTGNILEYLRYLNLKNGELVREILWESPKSEKYRLVFRRFVSLKDLHLVGVKISIIPLDRNVHIKIKTGIDGKMTNSGSQHFRDGDKRVFDGEFIQLVQSTTESNIDFAFNCSSCCYTGDFKSNTVAYQKKDFFVERRSIFASYEFETEINSMVTFEKLANVFTSRDRENIESYNLQNMLQKALDHLKHQCTLGYDKLFEESRLKWEQYWKIVGVELDSSNNTDELSLRFAQYHLLIMTPLHDERLSIGAKALTGEGYKGHVFWDTEVFILPYFQYNMPEVAKQLLKYRYLTLQGARNKAEKYGFKGAMYPWETAFTGEEETPEWAAINIMTGKRTRVWSGIKEHHITADIAYAVWNYYLSTGDVSFISEYGCEMLFECAWFWCSRAEWCQEKLRYEIKDVIGPDEYTEHIDNNAYTNYMARYTILIALKLYKIMNETNQELFERLDKKLQLKQRYDTYADIFQKLYIPQVNQQGIIPQDDTFLGKNEIDISKYRESNYKQSILLDYSRSQIIDLQVLKQADIVMLLYMFRTLFNQNVAETNWRYYEIRTIHDSSLSMAIHSIVANYFKDTQSAYKCYLEACSIDMGRNQVSSNEGIHAASMGGIWMAVVFGFGGVFNNEGILELDPVMPDEWERLKFNLNWNETRISIEITKKRVKIASACDKPIKIKVYGNEHVLMKNLELSY
jgi:hypothetical glycosyl hydrolase